MKNKKVHSLTGQITYTLVLEAFDAVYANQGAPGIDGMSLTRFSKNLEENLQSLMKALKNRTYNPEPLRRVYIPKADGGKRPLGIPTIRDRIAQEVIRRLLEPIFEPIFHPHSYGFRPKRGCHMAVEHILKLKAQGYIYAIFSRLVVFLTRFFIKRAGENSPAPFCLTHGSLYPTKWCERAPLTKLLVAVFRPRWVLDADIKGFFDNIPHHVIMRMLAEKVADGNILTIVEKFLKAGVFEDGQLKPTNSGTPQGGVVSQGDVLSPLISQYCIKPARLGSG
jgi:RNA-directed DNA polymerase